MIYGFSYAEHAENSAVPERNTCGEMSGDLENAANGSNLGGNPTDGSGRAKDSPVSSWKSYFKFPMMDKKTKILAAMVLGAVAALSTVGAGSQLFSRRRLIAEEDVPALTALVEDQTIECRYSWPWMGKTKTRTGILKVSNGDLYMHGDKNADYIMAKINHPSKLELITHVDFAQEAPAPALPTLTAANQPSRTVVMGTDDFNYEGIPDLPEDNDIFVRDEDGYLRSMLKEADTDLDKIIGDGDELLFRLDATQDPNVYDVCMCVQTSSLGDDYETLNYQRRFCDAEEVDGEWYPDFWKSMEPLYHPEGFELVPVEGTEGRKLRRK